MSRSLVSSSSSTMETEIVRVESVRLEVTPKMSNLSPSLGFTSSVLIDLREVIEEFKEDESGTTFVRSYINPTSVSFRTRILLKPRNFTPRYLSRLLRYQLNRENSVCRQLAEKISAYRFSSEANNSLRQGPFLMTVNVKVIEEVRFVVRPVVSVSLTGATRELCQRLLAEQRVESFDLDETCSVCIEKLSESSPEINGNNIIQMPNCLHLFHQDCIFEWLSLDNSCPMCRRVPYKEDQD